jgi:quinol monooxygenase YgiN
MIVVYVSFVVPTPNREQFDAWLRPLVEAARRETGCVTYDYLHDPQNPDRGQIVEIWQSKEDLDRHSVDPDHVEMVALGSIRWGMTDLHIHVVAGGTHSYVEQDRIDVPAPGREAMQALVDVVQERYRSGVRN